MVVALSVRQQCISEGVAVRNAYQQLGATQHKAQLAFVWKNCVDCKVLICMRNCPCMHSGAI